MISVQFKKGVLDLCVLALLAKKDRYGYELIEGISANVEISEGTIYPLLKRLKDEGYVTTYLEESDAGAARKYYSLTPRGREVLADMAAEWEDFVSKVNKILVQRHE
jgi:PadR family transcriptional regulator PadR